MKLYNSLTRLVEEVRPLNPPKITVYSCGPTVYDYAHIGHWFTYIRADILIRTLKSSALKPNWVMNITDVGHLVSDADEGEDKLEKGARREGKTAWEVADFYTRDFLDGAGILNILEPDHLVKATDHIAEQIELIEKLESKGYAYIIDDGVYYDTSKFEGYAAFARLDLDEQQAGSRVSFNPQKRNSSDFALWKFSPHERKRDMEWESPWGRGFPGWHIECSAMSMKYLGDTLDIHTGGIDHVPVHHTNEIAQSEAVTGKRFALHWMHSNHVMVNDQKISKSLGNGIRLQQILDKGIPAEAVRLHVLESHYRSHSKFSWESLEAAQNRLQSYRHFSDLLWQLPESAQSTQQILLKAQQAIAQILQNDLDTPSALALLSEVENQSLEILNTESQKTLKDFLTFLDASLGLNLAVTSNLTDMQYGLIARRELARKNEDWSKADELRGQLSKQGVGLRDTDNGAIWFRL